jgi:hypothetical protein
MKKETTYTIAFYCFLAFIAIVFFTIITSCSRKVVVMPGAPVHPTFDKTIVHHNDPTPQKPIK